MAHNAVKNSINFTDHVVSHTVIRPAYGDTLPPLKVKFGVYIPFNSKGNFGTVDKHYHLCESNPNRGESL